jgi:hypothetical protein
VACVLTLPWQRTGIPSQDSDQCLQSSLPMRVEVAGAAGTLLTYEEWEQALELDAEAHSPAFACVGACVRFNAQTDRRPACVHAQR